MNYLKTTLNLKPNNKEEMKTAEEILRERLNTYLSDGFDWYEREKGYTGELWHTGKVPLFEMASIMHEYASQFYTADEVREIIIKAVDDCRESAYVKLPSHPHLHGSKNVEVQIINPDKYLTK